MINIVACLTELAKIYSNTSSSKPACSKVKYFGYIFATLTFLAGIGFGYRALLNFLAPLWDEPYTSLIISIGSFTFAALILLIGCLFKPKPAPTFSIGNIVKTLTSLRSELFKGKKDFIISKNAWYTLLAIVGIYLLLSEKQDK